MAFVCACSRWKFSRTVLILLVSAVFFMVILRFSYLPGLFSKATFSSPVDTKVGLKQVSGHNNCSCLPGTKVKEKPGITNQLTRPSVPDPEVKKGTNQLTRLSVPDPEVKEWTNQLTRVPDAEVKLILLSYMRSGSTFTGDLFNHHPQVFYFYEPLWSFDFHFKKKEPLNFFHRSPVPFKEGEPDQLPSLQKETINATLNCQFRNINTQFFKTLRLGWAASKSQSCVPFAQCIKHTHGLSGLWDCMPLLEQACSPAKVTLVKTLRFTMKQAESLLKADPKVKVIHLVRDPRGTLRSRKVTGIGLSYHVTGEQLCAKALRDHEDAATLKSRYPGRVIMARYEDLAEQPLLFTERLLSFAGLDFPPALRQYVWNITSSGKSLKEGAGSTVRQDSQRTASHWRNDTQYRFVADVDSGCTKLYERMGYFSFASEPDLRDLSKPAYKDLKQLPWLWSL